MPELAQDRHVSLLRHRNRSSPERIMTARHPNAVGNVALIDNCGDSINITVLNGMHPWPHFLRRLEG